MEITKGETFETIKSNDENGDWEFTIGMTCPFQMRIESMDGDSDSYINLDYAELKAIRDAIDRFLPNDIS